MKGGIDMASKRFELNEADVKKWVRNTLIFSAPAMLAFLMALQAGGSPEFAAGAAYSAFLAAGIGLRKEFIKGK